MAEISLGGIRLALELDSGPASEFLEALVDAHRTEGPPAARIVVRGDAAPEPSGPVRWKHGRVAVLEQGSAWWVRGGATVAKVERAGHRAEIFEPPRERSGGWDRATASAALFLLLRIHRRFSLHAAAAEWRGSGYVIAGPSGVGKSTLSVLMALNGGRLRSDDTTLVGPSGELWPIAQGVRIDPASLVAHPEALPTGRPGVKRSLTELSPQGGEMSADVLLFPTLASTGSLDFEALSPGRALAMLLSASPYATERHLGDPSPQLAALASLANCAVSFRVTAGPALLNAPKAHLDLLPQK